MAARRAGNPDIRAFVLARAAEGASLAAISGEAGAANRKNRISFNIYLPLLVKSIVNP
jgi:hypothetical protein